MPRRHPFRQLTVPALALYTVAGLSLPAYASPISPFSYSNDFDKYGKTENFTCPAAEDGVCAAIAAINSFVFLQNQYPGKYDNLLVPNGDEDPMQPGVQANTDAMNFATDGWQVPGNPPREGYYDRLDNPGFDANEDYLQIKMDWIEDFAPGRTRYSSMFGAAGFPNVKYLAREIKHGEDVEFFVKNVDDPSTPEDESGASFYHALTLFGIACDAMGDCEIGYQDPNDPHTPFTEMIETVGGRLEFDHPDGGRVFIDAAFSESVPEPGALLLLGTGLAGLGGVALRRRRKPSSNRHD